MSKTKRKNLSSFAKALLDDEARDPSGKRITTMDLEDGFDGSFDKEMADFLDDETVDLSSEEDEFSVKSKSKSKQPMKVC